MQMILCWENLGLKSPELVDEQQEPPQIRDQQKYENVSKDLNLSLNIYLGHMK